MKIVHSDYFIFFFLSMMFSRKSVFFLKLQNTRLHYNSHDVIPMEILYTFNVSHFFFLNFVKSKLKLSNALFFIFRRSWSQKQADAKKQVNQATASQTSSASNKSQKFSYTAENKPPAAAASITTAAPPAATSTVWDKAPTTTAAPPANSADEKWQAKLNRNVAGTQQNAQDFTKEFMGQMYGSTTTQ